MTPEEKKEQRLEAEAERKLRVREKELKVQKMEVELDFRLGELVNRKAALDTWKRLALLFYQRMKKLEGKSEEFASETDPVKIRETINKYVENERKVISRWSVDY